MARENRLSSPHRLWIAAVLPAALIALVLTGLHARERAAAVEAQALEHASALARHFASLVAPELQRPGPTRLRATARAVVDHYPTIRRVAITDRDNLLLVRTEDEPASVSATPELRRIEQPIAAGAGLAPLGELAVDVDLSALQRGQPAAHWAMAGAAGLVLLSAMAALLLTNARRYPGRPCGQWQRLVPRSVRTRLQARSGRLAPDEFSASDLASADLTTALAQLRDDNQRLETARREAEAAARRKSRYLADIGHEIRTPMNAILGFTELMAQDQRRARQSDYAATIRDSVRGLLGLLNGVLDVSKAEAGRLELDYSNVDVETLFDEMFRLFAPQAFAKGVEVIAAPPSALPTVRTDAVRLKQILVNLLSNAIRFTEAGHIRLRADVAGETNTHVRLCLAVADTGCGISDAAQPRLFEAFMQAEHAIDDPRGPALEPGTGLGLNIASELAGVMGGRLEFDSEENRGSTFWLTFDLERGSSSASINAAPPKVHRRIALIDPDPITREAYGQLLERAGLAVEVLDAAEWSAATVPDCYDAIVVHIPAYSVATDAIAPVDPSLQRTAIPLVALVHEHGGASQQALWHAGYRRTLAKTTNPSTLREGLEAALVAESIAGDPAAPAGGTPSAPSAVHRVLMVDDHPVNLQLMRQYLADEGLAVVTAATSGEALRCAAHERFDAIVLDLRLPDRDGRETARLLRARAGPNADAPIVAVTADCPAAEAEGALGAGCDDVLGKPLDQETLLARLRAWIPALAPERAPGTDDHEAPVIDRDQALARARNQPELADELFTTLCRTLPASRRALTLARLRGDCGALRAEAHRLRGAVVYCSVPRLEAALGDLDDAMSDGEAIPLARAVHRLEREITAVLTHAPWAEESERAGWAGTQTGERWEANPPI